MTLGSLSSPQSVAPAYASSAMAAPARVRVTTPLPAPSNAYAYPAMSYAQASAMPAYAGYYHPSLNQTNFTKAQAPQSHVSFGSCICPICASMAIIVETHKSIKKLESGDGIVPGETMAKITAKTGFNYIPHERATRLEAPAVSDVDNIERAAMTRIPAPGGREILEIPRDEKSLYSTVSAALMMAPHKVKEYAAHPNDILYSPLGSQAMGNTLKALKPGQYQVLSVLHHLQNADDRVTKPFSLGYMMLGAVNPAQKELAVMSVRPIPKMENMNAGPAGVANLLTHLATDKAARYDSLAVTVEPAQGDLKHYLEELKQLGVDVKRYARLTDNQKPNGVAVAPMPKAYEPELNKLYPQSQPAIYTVDVKGLRQWLTSGLPETVSAQASKLNPDLHKALETLQKDQAKPGPGLSAEALLTVLMPSPPPGARRPLPREEELGHH
jgi:hypothetical protein